jgi:glycosyltransferase involved in cell wall biosynthesis
VLYFIAARLDAHDGASRSAVEILHHILQLEPELVVVSQDRCALPTGPAGEQLYTVHWTTPPAPIRKILASGLSPRRWVRWARALPSHLSRRFQMIYTMERYPPSISIHNGFPVPGSNANWALRRAPRRTMVVHSSPEQVPFFQRKGGNKLLTVEWVAARMARVDSLVFVSPQIRDAWSRIANISGTPRSVLSNTCRESDAAAVMQKGRAELRASLDLPRDAFIAVCVGNVNPGKGQDTLIDALPGMLETVPDLLLVCVGYDSTAWALELKKTIAERGLAHHLRFTGPRSDPYAFIHAADLMIHPSRAEGQGMVILEAMLLRTPVLATNVGGIPSCVTDGDTGVLVPPDDPDAILHAFRAIAGDAELRAGLARRAEVAYWSRFSRGEYAKRFGEIFGGIIAESRAALAARGVGQRFGAALHRWLEALAHGRAAPRPQ